jgi:hypothetical protein
LTGDQEALLELCARRGDDLTGAMAEDHRAHSQVVIDEIVTVEIYQVSVVSLLEDQWMGA